MVPCAQGRIIIETARPAPPHFATCSGYRRRPMLIGADSVASFGYTDLGKGAVPRSGIPQSPAARPEDLGVTPWFADEPQLPTSPASGLDPHRNSQPFHRFYGGDRDLRNDFSSTRNSSVEGEPPPRTLGAQRKAYMDLRDAIALLDETCPNPEASEPSPRTPRTPVTAHQKNKRARSKSSDNSSNYSNERLSDKSGELNQQSAAAGGRNQEREKKRPFLRKIGISKTEDRPFLSKFAPRIIGKPYLEKIGPSKAVEKPFLDKIGSSKTIDKFTFNVTPRKVNPPEADRAFVEVPTPAPRRLVPREARISFRKRSGKGQLQKMYSFETEDLNSFKGSLSPVKSPRDPLRGASLDDVLESGPSSLPPLEAIEQPQPEITEPKSHSVAELVKCRIMSSEEIISSSSCLCSPQEAVSWGNSPKRKNVSLKPASINSPVKRQMSSGDLPEPKSKELAILRAGENSPTKSRMSSSIASFGSSTLPNPRKDAKSESELESPRKRQTSEEVLDRMEESEGRRNRAERRQTRSRNQNNGCLERRGISSDNLKMSREIFIAASSLGESRREIFSDNIRRKERQDISRETFKQLHSKFETNNFPSNEESNELHPNSSSRLLKTSRFYLEQKSSSNEKSTDHETEESKNDEEETGVEDAASPSGEEDEAKVSRSMKTVRSVLRKQKSIDQPIEVQESEARSVRKPKRRIFHEPSQETMDLLTELRKVKSLLKTPSVEKLEKPDDFAPLKLPKKILLTDKEFCLSIDRENSVRRAPSRMAKEKDTGRGEDEEEKKEEEEEEEEAGKKGEVEVEEKKSAPLPGPALFEKRGLSLDYVDDDKPAKPEARAISLASARSPPSETEETNSLEFGFICDSKSYCSDVFNTPTSDETMDNSLSKEKSSNGAKELDNSVIYEDGRRNHCAEVDIAIPIDQKSSPKRRVQIQGRTSDLYEIISPRSTPFRVKQRLSKISVEDTMKQESFTLGKVDCKSVAVQKRNRCFPL